MSFAAGCFNLLVHPPLRSKFARTMHPKPDLESFSQPNTRKTSQFAPSKSDPPIRRHRPSLLECFPFVDFASRNESIYIDWRAVSSKRIFPKSREADLCRDPASSYRETSERSLCLIGSRRRRRELDSWSRGSQIGSLFRLSFDLMQIPTGGYFLAAGAFSKPVSRQKTG